MKTLLFSPLLTLALMLCLVTPGNAALDFSNNYYPYIGQPTTGDYEVS